VEEIKTSSNTWIKQNNLTKYKFEWQRGYGAFTHSHAQLDRVIRYIRNQQNHHHKKTFREEYIQMLVKYNVNFKHEYLFDFHDSVK
jgi:hypothetical protein